MGPRSPSRVTLWPAMVETMPTPTWDMESGLWQDTGYVSHHLSLYFLATHGIRAVFDLYHSIDLIVGSIFRFDVQK